MHSTDEMIQWLQNWVYSNYEQNQETKVVLTTIDNPGWGMTVDLGSNFPEKKLPLADVEKTENDWYYCTIKNNKFEGDGGLFNLEDVFCVFKSIIKNGIKQSTMNNDLMWLLQWYANQCNGDWEHAYGITIETVDNPGWYVTVDLEDTCLENALFEKVKENQDDLNWFFCLKRGNKFEALCGPCNLNKIFQIFRQWAESCAKDEEK